MHCFNQVQLVTLGSIQADFILPASTKVSSGGRRYCWVYDSSVYDNNMHDFRVLLMKNKISSDQNLGYIA